MQTSPRYLFVSGSLVALCALPLVIAGCKPKGKPGDACVVTGDGFTRKDSCADMCVNWAVTCPDGQAVTPDLCAGAPCVPGESSCGAGQLCLQIDSFVDNSRCMPAAICGLAGSGPTQMTHPPDEPEPEGEELLESGN